MPTGFPDYYGGLTLPVTVPEGGTGLTTIPANSLLLGNTTGVMVPTNVGTANQVLQIPSGGGAPQFQSISISAGAVSGVLPLANGGTGTATPALVAGTGISITGSWPNNTIANTSNYATLADPLPVAHGGTGTASPALVAGSNISITGTWPAQTIACVSSPVFSGEVTSKADFTANTDTFPSYAWANAAATQHWKIFESTSSGAQGPLVVYDSVHTAARLTIDTSGNVTLAVPLGVGQGGTGATSLLAAGIPQIVASIDLTAQTAAITLANVFTPTAAGMYRVTAELFVNTSTETTGNMFLSVAFTQEATAETIVVTPSTPHPAAGVVMTGTAAFYSDANKGITYSVLIASGGAISYDVHLRLEAM